MLVKQLTIGRSGTVCLLKIGLNFQVNSFASTGFNFSIVIGGHP